MLVADFAPYNSVIDANQPQDMMTAHINMDLLGNELGYRGVTITDALNINRISSKNTTKRHYLSY